MHPLDTCLDALNRGNGLVHFEQAPAGRVDEDDDVLVMRFSELADVASPGHAVSARSVHFSACTTKYRKRIIVAVARSCRKTNGWCGKRNGLGHADVKPGILPADQKSGFS